jgi:hypothetical protein
MHHVTLHFRIEHDKKHQHHRVATIDQRHLDNFRIATILPITVDQIQKTAQTTRINGCNAMMLVFFVVLDSEVQCDVVHYVRSLLGLTVDNLWVQWGKLVYVINCAVCYGAEGCGN